MKSTPYFAAVNGSGCKQHTIFHAVCIAAMLAACGCRWSMVTRIQKTKTIIGIHSEWIPRAGFVSRLCPLGWLFPHCPRGRVPSRATNTAAHVAVRTARKGRTTPGDVPAGKEQNKNYKTMPKKCENNEFSKTLKI